MLGEVVPAGIEFGDADFEFCDLGVDHGFAAVQAAFLIAQVFLVDLEAGDVVVQAGELPHEVDGFGFVLVDAAIQASDRFGGLFLLEGGFGDFGFVLAEFLVDGGDGFFVALHIFGGIAGVLRRRRDGL